MSPNMEEMVGRAPRFVSCAEMPPPPALRAWLVPWPGPQQGPGSHVPAQALEARYCSSSWGANASQLCLSQQSLSQALPDSPRRPQELRAQCPLAGPALLARRPGTLSLWLCLPTLCAFQAPANDTTLEGRPWPPVGESLTARYPLPPKAYGGDRPPMLRVGGLSHWRAVCCGRARPPVGPGALGGGALPPPG